MQAQPAQTAPQPIQKSPIVTLRYQGGPPPPHPPVTEPTPQEEYQMAAAQRQAVMAQREQAVAAAPPATSGATSFFKAVQMATAKVQNVASSVHAAGEDKVRALIHQQNQERFEKNFPELVQAGETLTTDYECKVMSQGVKLTGHMQLTARYICFVNDAVKEAVPLQEVASIQRSIALDTVDNGPPFIMPIPAPHVLPDTLQLFTTQQKVYQFLAFESAVAKVGTVVTSTVKGRAIDRAYNFVDHAWRAAVQVPLPGVQYAQF